MKLIKITKADENVYENKSYEDCFKVPAECRKLQLNTLKDRSIHIIFNDNNNLVDIDEPFYVKIKENTRCYNNWEVQPTYIEKDTGILIEFVNIDFGITKYMLGFTYANGKYANNSNVIHYIDPEYVDFIGLQSEGIDSEPEVEKADEKINPEPEVKKVTKSKSKSKSKSTSRKTKSTTTTKNTNPSKNIKNMCDIGKPGFSLDDKELKKLNESINDNVNKLCILIERKDKVNKIISALSESSENIKADSNFYFNVKIIPLDLDINIPSEHLFDTKDINKLILDYHKKEYDSIKEEIGILKGSIFKDLDILLTGEEK